VSVEPRRASGAPEDSLMVALEQAVPRHDGRIRVELVERDGRAAMIDFRVRLDTVEVWREGHCWAVLDRDVLRAWLREPLDALVVDEAMLSLDRAVDVRGRLALTLTGHVHAWTLSPTEEQTLRARV
jgi:hypothetical protein